jgi:hypothetical protein
MIVLAPSAGDIAKNLASQAKPSHAKRETQPPLASASVPNNAPALLIRMSIGGSRLAISAATRFISAKRVRSAKYTEWAGARLVPRDQDDTGAHAVQGLLARMSVVRGKIANA